MTDIDPALAVELKALALQKPMNDIIDRGDSAIQQLYNDTTVFITGGCGFIGKQLIEKLLRACRIKKIFVLVRPKNGKTIQQRIDATLCNSVFDALRNKKPDFAERIVPIDGNVSELGLGLSSEDWKLLTQEVNIIFHAAATIRFDEPLQYATLTNVRGTRETLLLAKQCQNFMKYVYVSTAFSHATQDRVKKELLEDFYQCPVPPETMISLAEEVDDKRLNSITMELTQGWPNTYTFTKAIAEELVRTTAGDLPSCIVRPPIVTPSYYEPSPGWLDLSTLAGPSGIYLGIALGFVKVYCVDGRNHMSMAPVDYVNNAIIASVWDSDVRKSEGQKNVPVYNITRKDFFQWNEIGYNMRYNLSDLYISKAIWYCGMLETKNKYLYKILAFFCHYVPAFFLDIICTVLRKKPKEIPSFVELYRKVDKLTKLYNYFLMNEWSFSDNNLKAMLNRMSVEDKAIFNCDLNTIDITEYVRVWGIGLRKYIIKDGLKNSAKGVRKQEILGYIHCIVVPIYIFIWWLIFKTLYNIIVNILF